MPENFRNFSQKYTGRIESFISEFYKSKSKENSSALLKEIYSDIEEYCLRPGKRIRPLLLLAAYSGYCENFTETQMSEIIKLASVLEIMHSFLLIHDDVIDKANMRRGKESMHVIHRDRYKLITKNETVGSDAAIITGDMMSFDCIEIITGADIDAELKCRFLKVFAETYIYTTWGQLLDVVNSLPHVLNIDSSLPYEISLYKTTFYTICNPMIMGNVLSGKSNQDEIQAIKDFSLPLGLSFQFKDDLLGVFGIDKTIGKSSDSDIIEGKYTLLTDYALQNLCQSDRNIFKRLFVKTEKTDNEIIQIREFIEKSGSKEMAMQKVQELSVESLNKLEKLRVSNDVKSVLKDVVLSVAEVKFS